MEVMMKVIQSIFITFLGLIVAVLFYPFLHEFGHSLATMLVGGNIKEFVLFPLPYVVCELNEITNVQIVIIGLSGMLFPIIFSFVIHSNNFWLWLIGLYLNVICFISFVISFISCIKYVLSKPIINEDITQILDITSGNAWIWMMFFLVFAVLITMQIIKSHPIYKCYKLKQKCK